MFDRYDTHQLPALYDAPAARDCTIASGECEARSARFSAGRDAPGCNQVCSDESVELERRCSACAGHLSVRDLLSFNLFENPLPDIV